MRLRFGLIAAIVTLLIASAALASGPAAVDCAANPCVYLPLIRAQQAPTATPTVAPTEQPSIPRPSRPAISTRPRRRKAPRRG
jgi:hypothetical protein